MTANAGRRMRVLFTCIDHTTHFHSMVPLAWAMRLAGHEVRVAAQPGLAETITGAGLTAVPLGSDHTVWEHQAALAGQPGNAPRIDFTDLLDGAPDFADLLGLWTILTPTVFAPLNDLFVDELTEYAQHWKPDLVLWEPFTYAGGVAATVCGARHARLLWGADVLGRSRRALLGALDRMPPEHHDDPLGEWLGWTLHRYGCTFDEDVAFGHWTIEVEPPSLRLPTDEHVLSTRYVPYNGPSRVPDWLRNPPDVPRVCVTLGVSARDGKAGVHSVPPGELLHAVADLGVEVVATLTAEQAETLGRLPDSVRVVDRVPLHALLPHCDAIVHHGGAGTWGTALHYAVPQVIVPEIWDAPLKARMLADTGAGLTEPVGGLTTESLREAVRRVLTEPEFSEAARRLRAEMEDQPGPAELAAELQRLVLRSGRSA